MKKRVTHARTKKKARSRATKKIKTIRKTIYSPKRTRTTKTIRKKSRSKLWHKPKQPSKKSKLTGRTRYNVKAFYQKKSPEFYLANKKYIKFPKSLIIKTKSDILAVSNIIEIYRPTIQKFFDKYSTKKTQFFTIGYDIALFIDKKNGSGFKRVLRQVSYMESIRSFGKANLEDIIDSLIKKIDERVEIYLTRKFKHYVKIYGLDLEIQTKKGYKNEAKRN